MYVRLIKILVDSCDILHFRAIALYNFLIYTQNPTFIRKCIKINQIQYPRFIWKRKLLASTFVIYRTYIDEQSDIGKHALPVSRSCYDQSTRDYILVPRGICNKLH